MKKLIRSIISSIWMLPLAFLLLGFALAGPALLALSADSNTACLIWETGMLLWLLSGLALGLWLVVFCVRDIAVHHTPWRALWRLLLALLCGGLSFCLALMSVICMMFGPENDHAADDWTLPQGVQLEVPQGMTLFGNMEYTDEVRQMVTRAEAAHPMAEPLELPPGETHFTGATPNLDKLVQEHPELLERLYERSCALLDAHLLTARAEVRREERITCCVMLQHGDDRTFTTAPYALSAGVDYRGRDNFPELRRLSPDWRLCASCNTWLHDTPVDDPQLVAAASEQLDAALAPLAENPTTETLDRLLPLPQLPCLRLREGFQAGLYLATVLLPPGTKEGVYTISATEYNTGTELSLSIDRHPLKWHHGKELDTLRGELTDYTGNWGQFYGSKWTVKDGKGKPILTQPFLMQGWQR